MVTEDHRHCARCGTTRRIVRLVGYNPNLWADLECGHLTLIT